MPIRSVQAHAPAFSITGEPVFPYPLRTFRPRRFGKARSGVICHQAVLTGLTPSPARFPRLVLRRPHPCAFPFIIAAFSPFCKGDLQIFQGRRQRLCLWTPAGLCLAPAKGLRPSRHPFAIELSFLSYCFRVFMRGFRLCGGDQRALRSPSGLLRSTLQCYLIFIVAGGIRACGRDKGAATALPLP